MEKLKIEQIVSQLTLEEKATLCSGKDFWNTEGVERLGIPSMMVTDGPHGLRRPQGSTKKLGIYDSKATTCFPSGCALAASFDRELLYRMGKLLGQACQAEEVGMILGPAINIKRSPLGGRNFEYYSEDPLLAGEMGAAIASGIQSEGVSSCVKHFAANNQETRRFSSNSLVSQRALREIYLTPFETVVKKATPWAVMCAYNQVNNIFCAENKLLLTDILRNEWGFDGAVLTDWGAIKDCVKGIAAGVNLEMPASGDRHPKQIMEAVKSGELEEAVLDRSVAEVIRLLVRWQENRRPETGYDREYHYWQAVSFARECAVLLKNEQDILPLSRDSRVAFLGEFAVHPRYQGMGSSRIHSYRTQNALESAIGCKVRYARGYDIDKTGVDASLLEEAVAAAKEADVAVIFAGLPGYLETEGFDRNGLELPENHVALIQAVAEVNPNVVVVLHNGGPVTMPWEKKVKAILELYLAGDGVGQAAIDLLYGNANPCGKLAETFPKRLSDVPSFLDIPGERNDVHYSEGIFVGYRYYDKKDMEVLYPFGHGLSYTSFEYSNLTLDKDAICEGEPLRVALTVRNTGALAGKEIVQLYVRNVKGYAIRPIRELREYAKVSLESGESKEITFLLNARAFSYYDEKEERFALESGTYWIEAASSSRDVRCAVPVTVTAQPSRPIPVDAYTCVADIQDRPTGRLMYQKLYNHYTAKPATKEEQESSKRDIHALVSQMPLSVIPMFTGMPAEELDGCIRQIQAEANEEERT